MAMNVIMAGQMQTTVFNKIRTLIYNSSGIHLNDDKMSLVSARIAKRMRKLNLVDHREYLVRVMEDQSGGEFQHLLDSISTNVTSFYREADHFSFMREILKNWAGSGLKKVKIWSAACSTGEEPFTIAIEACEALGNHKMDVKLLATDINSDVLKTAQIGEYSERRFDTMPRYLRDRYFTKAKRGESVNYVAKDNLQRIIIFRQFNLSRLPFPMKNKFDIIFCRNVMIYFDSKLRTNLVNEFGRLLKPGGYLFLGHAEGLPRACTGFEGVAPAIYKKE